MYPLVLEEEERGALVPHRVERQSVEACASAFGVRRCRSLNLSVVPTSTPRGGQPPTLTVQVARLNCHQSSRRDFTRVPTVIVVETLQESPLCGAQVG